MKIPESLQSFCSAEAAFWTIAILAMLLHLTVASPAFFDTQIHRLSGDGPLGAAWLRHSWHFVGTACFFLLLPAAALRLTTGLSLAQAGVQVGEWRLGLALTGMALVVLPGVVYVSSADPEFLEQYPHTMQALASIPLFAGWSLLMLVYYVAWEFFFRGYLLFGLKDRVGAVHAVFIQTALSTVIHIGKPTGELVGAFPGGLYMGWLALRTRSLVWPIAFHWILGVLNLYFCGMRKL